MNKNLVTSLEPIRLFHCPKCDYEAGQRSVVLKHIEKHKYDSLSRVELIAELEKHSLLPKKGNV